MITVRDLTKRFHTTGRREVTAVDGLCFTVSRGEVYGLLGPNGAGKTTTLRMLATLVEPDEGTVLLGGVDVRENPLRARSTLAYVPAEGGLPTQLSGREVLRLFARVQGVQDPDGAADRLLDQMGALPYADAPCGELSTGMKRRVVLARALVHAPSVLLLDEPTDGLDVPGRRDVLQLIRDQARAGRAVILSSHVMGEVARVVDRVGILRGGRLVAEGSLHQVLALTGASDLDDAFLTLVGST